MQKNLWFNYAVYSRKSEGWVFILTMGSFALSRSTDPHKWPTDPALSCSKISHHVDIGMCFPQKFWEMTKCDSDGRQDCTCRMGPLLKGGFGLNPLHSLDEICIKLPCSFLFFHPFYPALYGFSSQKDLTYGLTAFPLVPSHCHFL